MYREIQPTKIIEKRGPRSRREIVEAAGGVGLSEMDLYYFERGRKPSPKKLPLLLRGLGVSFDEISEPVDLGVGV